MESRNPIGYYKEKNLNKQSNRYGVRSNGKPNIFGARSILSKFGKFILFCVIGMGIAMLVYYQYGDTMFM